MAGQAHADLTAAVDAAFPAARAALERLIRIPSIGVDLPVYHGTTEETLRVKLTQTELVAHGQWLVLAVEVRATGRVVGEVLLKWASERQGELGFAFARDVHGQGYAVEAATAVLDLAFDGLGFHRVSAVVIEGNDGSARLLGRLGFRQEARHVDGVHFKGAWATQLVFALLEDEWRGPSAVG